MRQQIIPNKREKELLEIVNKEIRICIIRSYKKIESFEFGISCEGCWASFGRKK